ncbi:MULTISPECIES: NADH-quinone oxidoreductase subunit E [unclassified Haematobacter]|uniref:NADH-quinone oxidoreductase subunit E n=1 Tax=unclassified Haematobacter TaxID=2640585 RepID=UPI0025C3A516|nr:MULTISPECIES: NADH-quinone oxidoreductase subunit E [unclassified Haematobacter]
MLRRLYHAQPNHFEFAPANLDWAKAQISKYPEGRQASAVIPLLWRAQEQEGWLTKPAIEYVADMLGMAYIRVLEVATFYFMFQLQPTGTVAHVQICGTTSCMICGAEDLMAVCKKRINAQPHELSADGKFSWEEVECLGACSGAPMAQIGKDYYENLTEDKLVALLDDLAAGKVPVPGPQNGRFSSEPATGLTSLTDLAEDRPERNASVTLALAIGDTVKRIDGTEVPLNAPWLDRSDRNAPVEGGEEVQPTPGAGHPIDETGISIEEAPVETVGRPEVEGTATGGTATGEPGQPVAGDDPEGRDDKDVDQEPESDPKVTAEDAVILGGGAPTRPGFLPEPREGEADNLLRISGVGPKLEKMLHDLGIFHFDQIAAWTAEDLAWIDAHLHEFKGRALREDWIGQAKILAAGGETDHSRKVERGEI